MKGTVVAGKTDKRISTMFLNPISNFSSNSDKS